MWILYVNLIYIYIYRIIICETIVPPPLINTYIFAVAWTFALNAHVHTFTITHKPCCYGPLCTLTNLTSAQLSIHACTFTFLCSTMSKINSSFALLLATTGLLECVECSWNYKGIKASRLIHGQISDDKPVGFGGPRPDTEICNTVTQAHFVPAAFLPLGSVCLALWGFFVWHCVWPYVKLHAQYAS